MKLKKLLSLVLVLAFVFCLFGCGGDEGFKVGLICLVFAIVLMILTKMVSVGSIAAAILYPVLILKLAPIYLL